MYPLIEIKTVPIEIQMKTTAARLEYARGTAQMEITRDKGGLSIRSQPIRIRLDTFEARNSVVPTTATSIQQAAQKGRQLLLGLLCPFSHLPQAESKQFVMVHGSPLTNPIKPCISNPRFYWG